jgi:hypothetical protein
MMRILTEKQKRENKERCKKWYYNHREEQMKKKKEERVNPLTREKILNSQNKSYYKNHEKNCICSRIQSRERRKKAKKLIISHYSNGKNCCEICGITDIEVLTLDHINGGGRKHKEKIGGSSYLYRNLINNNFPEGYRILCMNCNFKEALRKKLFVGHNTIDFSSIDNTKVVQ